MRGRIIERGDFQPCWQNWRYIRLLYHYFYYKASYQASCGHNTDKAENSGKQINFQPSLIMMPLPQWGVLVLTLSISVE